MSKDPRISVSGGDLEPDRNSSQPDHARGGVIDNPWSHLREFTDARIGLGRAGISLPTHQLLAFQMAHAKAQDAVHLPLDVPALCEQLTAIASRHSAMPPLQLASQATDRTIYLQRPDLGRCLSLNSREQLSQDIELPSPAYDLAIVVVDGLSSLAVQNNAPPLIEALCDELTEDTSHNWHLAPLAVVQQGRVAIGDEVGEQLNANAVLVLIGERPGLSSPDSLGIYLSWGPRKGLTDANRNCISNVRPAGLGYADASKRLIYLLHESKRRKLSGVQLKDCTEDDVIEHHEEPKNFLLS